VLVDWKGGSVGPWNEQILQSVAYRKALEQMGVPAPITGMLVRIPRTKGKSVETFRSGTASKMRLSASERSELFTMEAHLTKEAA